MDKNQAMIDYLNTCPAIRDNPLFFNFINAKEDNKQLITLANDKTLNTHYIDGSVLKRYTLTIIDYKSIVYQAIPKLVGYSDKNVEEMFDVQQLMDWVTEQDKARNFPDFGENCVVESIKTVTENPNLNGVDSSVSPAQAKYSFSIQVEYMDTTDVLWRKE
jgi:hypothetical protein